MAVQAAQKRQGSSLSSRWAQIWAARSRRSTEIIEDDAADILHIMPAIELPRQGKKDITYYRKVWQQRIDPKGGALHTMRDK
ncbi:MAG: hypothetical protein FWG14_00965 [Peptococcaceae bacterium]|nr:hypothetical protein [Peptococcaceae bacterium]